ncbi:hypothetical protein [Actinokineospora sp. NPDC004072]
MSGELVRSGPWANWPALAVVCIFLAAPAPGLLKTELGVDLPAAAVGAVSAAVACEIIWRFGIRPRLLWNEGGLAIVHPLSVCLVRWSEVATVELQGNAIRVSASAGQTHEWDFDRMWWLARLSDRYASRGVNAVEEMRSHLGRGEAHRLPAAELSRPWVMWLVVAATALLAHFVTPFVIALDPAL